MTQPLFAADIIGCLCGYAHVTNTRSLAVIGDADAEAYELLFSFSSPKEKTQFLDLVRSNATWATRTSKMSLPSRQSRRSGTLDQTAWCSQAMLSALPH